MTELRTDVPIETDRLVLRALRDTDVDDVHAFQRDPDTVRYLPWDVRTPEQTREWLAGRIAADCVAGDGDAVAWAVERRSDGRVIGSVNLWWRSVEHQQGEIGYVFAPDVRGHGYAFEATAALLDVAFATLELHRVYADTDARNDSSVALLRRLGMRQEAHLRQCEWFKGEWGDLLIYAILRQEWEAARGQSQAHRA